MNRMVFCKCFVTKQYVTGSPPINWNNRPDLCRKVCQKWYKEKTGHMSIFVEAFKWIWNNSFDLFVLKFLRTSETAESEPCWNSSLWTTEFTCDLCLTTNSPMRKKALKARRKIDFNKILCILFRTADCKPVTNRDRIGTVIGGR